MRAPAVGPKILFAEAACAGGYRLVFAHLQCISHPSPAKLARQQTVDFGKKENIWNVLRVV